MAISRALRDLRARSEVATRLRQVTEILVAAHGTPDLGNVTDPLEELIYLLIAQRTRIGLARDICVTLKRQYSSPESILAAPPEELTKLLTSGGRGTLRARAIRELLQAVKEREGCLSLARLKRLDESRAFQELVSLPWVGEKTARCVMLYSLGIMTFPADSNAIRILNRTRLLEPLIGSLANVEHRPAQRMIAEVVPPDVARELHVNLVAHGQKICRDRNPLCGRCPIQKFCAYWRERETKSVPDNAPAMVDLFCGIGGISLGFHQEGYRVVLAVDNDPATVDIYKLNHPRVLGDHVLCRDVRSLSPALLSKLLTGTQVDILVAGVPCQGYSRVGYRTKPELAKHKQYRPERDPRNLLFKQVIRVARILRPQFVLLENVPDMRIANVTYYGSDARVIDLLNRSLGRLGYHCGTVLLDASRFGVSQKRTRLFFVASKVRLPDRIDETLLAIARTQRDPLDSSLRASIGDLPAVEADSGKFVTRLNNDGALIFNHAPRFHNNDDLKIIRALTPGETYASLIERKPEVLAGRTHKIYRKEHFPDKFFRLRWDFPSRTIVSHLAKDGNGFIHPDQDRSITVREAARIQSFPDEFIFTQSRHAQYVGIGNAVPPALARTFARFFRELMSGNS